MLGKAGEIKVEEKLTYEVNGWLKENPDVAVIDIKYAVIPESPRIQASTWALIIYKEVSNVPVK